MPEPTQLEHPRMVNNNSIQGGAGQGAAEHNAVIHHGIFSSLSDHFKKHQAVWLIGLGIATLVVMFLAYRNKSQQSSTVSAYPVNLPNQVDPLNQGNYDPAMAPDWYTGLTNSINQNTSALGNIANLLGQKPSTTPTTPPTTPPPGATPSSSAGLGAAVNYQLPANTQIYPGSQGRWWFKAPGGTQQLLTGPHGTDMQTWLPENQFERIVAGSNGSFSWQQGGVGPLKSLVPTRR